MCSSARLGLHFTMSPPKKSNLFEAISFPLKIVKLQLPRLNDHLPAEFKSNSLSPNSLSVDIVKKIKAVKSVNNFWLM